LVINSNININLSRENSREVVKERSKKLSKSRENSIESNKYKDQYDLPDDTQNNFKSDILPNENDTKQVTLTTTSIKVNSLSNSDKKNLMKFKDKQKFNDSFYDSINERNDLQTLS